MSMRMYVLLLWLLWFHTFCLDTILQETKAAEHHPKMSRKYSLDSTLSPTSIPSAQNPFKFEVGSTIQYGNPVEYGVIKWIGRLPGKETTAYYAGVEMVSYENCKYYAIFKPGTRGPQAYALLVS